MNSNVMKFTSEKKIFTKDQNFICPSPYYNITLPDGRIKKLFTHRAIRCNGDPECWGGEDEKGCKIVETTAKYIIPVLVFLLVIIALTSTSWTKKLFGRGDEKTISISQPTLDQLKSLVEGDEDQIKAMIIDENVSEVLTMAQ